MPYLFIIIVLLGVFLFGENPLYQLVSRVELWGMSWSFSYLFNYLFVLTFTIGIIVPVFTSKWPRWIFGVGLLMLILNRLLFLFTPDTITSFQGYHPSLFWLTNVFGEVAFWLIVLFLAWGIAKKWILKFNKPVKWAVCLFSVLIYALYIVLFNPVYVDDFQNNLHPLTAEEKSAILPLFEGQLNEDENQLIIIFSSGCYYCAQHAPIMNISSKRIKGVDKYKVYIQGSDEKVNSFIDKSGLKLERSVLPDENILELSQGIFPAYYLMLDGKIYLYHGEELSYRALDFVESSLKR